MDFFLVGQHLYYQTLIVNKVQKNRLDQWDQHASFQPHAGRRLPAPAADALKIIFAIFVFLTTISRQLM